MILQGHARLLDGQNPMPQPIGLHVDEGQGALVVSGPGGPLAIWPLGQVRRVRDQAGDDQLTLHLGALTTERLIVTDPDLRAAIEARCPGLDRGEKVRNLPQVLAWGLGAIAAGALIVLVMVPLLATQLSAVLPASAQKALGDATFNQIRRAMSENEFMPVLTCENPAGLAALAVVEAKLAAGLEQETDFNVFVLDHPMVNAFALPGNYIVFFDGLLQEAESAEEVAAVFAHEMGHVVNRDPTRIALQTTGTLGIVGLFFGDFAGGAVLLFLTERLIQADYTQAAEAEADRFAHDLLLKAGIAPSAIGTFFERLREDHGDSPALVAHFESHPQMGDRIAAARAATPAGATFTPALSAADWAALQGICD